MVTAPCSELYRETRVKFCRNSLLIYPRNTDEEVSLPSVSPVFVWRNVTIMYEK